MAHFHRTTLFRRGLAVSRASTPLSRSPAKLPHSSRVMALSLIHIWIAAILAQERVEPRCLTLKNLGGRFAPQGTVDQLYRAFGLDARSVADSVEEMLHEQ